MGIILVHGGAGTLFKGRISEQREYQTRQGLQKALQQGVELLRQGADAVDAVVEAVSVLENCEVFNAGRGSVYTHEGSQEMDAALMEGLNRQAGAVAMVQGIRNPIQLAHAVLKHSPHVLLAGKGAEAFALEHNIAQAEAEYFSSEYRWEQLLKIRDQAETALDHDLEGNTTADGVEASFGTVGAVALDRQGHLAAATSTGGMTNKRYGRIGDTPIIGQGTYADDQSCAVSATGHGEFIMRANLAYDLAARMKYLGCTVKQAASEALNALTELNGGGGLIALDAQGNWAMPFNTGRMYRGVLDLNGDGGVWIYE